MMVLDRACDSMERNLVGTNLPRHEVDPPLKFGSLRSDVVVVVVGPASFISTF